MTDVCMDGIAENILQQLSVVPMYLRLDTALLYGNQKEVGTAVKNVRPSASASCRATFGALR